MQDKAKNKADVERFRQEQHTGNHGDSDRPEEVKHGPDKFGGTRTGAENVEHGKAEGKNRGKSADRG